MDFMKLREKAEKILKQKHTDFSSSDIKDVKKILEELQIHQIELELQNEELRQTQLNLEKSRENFIKFYEKAPVGYLILNHRGIILNVNETLCELLNYDKTEMINVPLFGFIHRSDQEEFLGRYKAFFKKPQGKIYNLKLLKRGDEALYSELAGIKQEISLEKFSYKSEEVLLLSVNDITPRIKTDALRKTAEKKLSNLYKQTWIGLAEVAPDGKFLQVNERLCQILGYPREELLTKTFQDITHPDDLYLDNKYIKEVLEGTRDSFEIDKRYIHKDSSIVWISLYSNVVRDRYGDVEYAIASIADISQRKEMEMNLLDKQQKLELAMASAHEGMWEWDLKTGKACFDKNALAMLGYEPYFRQDGEWWINQIHPQDKENVQSAITEFLQNKIDNYRVEFRLRKKDGDYTWVQSTGAINVRDEEGKPLIFTGIHRDISRRKERVHKLREFEFIVDSVQEPMSILDNEYRYIKVNKAYQKFYNLPLEEIEGKTVEELMGKETFEKTIKPHFDKCLSGEIVHYNRWFDLENSEPFYHDVTYYPYTDENGRISRVVVSSRDITAWKLAEEKAKKSENLLQQIYNVSIPLCLINTDFQIERVNDAFCSLFELEESQIVGKNCYQVWKGPFCETDSCLLQLIKDGAEKGSYLFDKSLPSGNKISCQVFAKPVFDKDGNLYGIIETFSDITELKKSQLLLQANDEEIIAQNEELQAQNDKLISNQKELEHLVKKLQEAEQLLKETNLRFQFFSEVTLEGIIISENFQVIDANEAISRMTGYSKEEALGMEIVDFFPATIDKNYMREVIKQEQKTPNRIVLQRKDGSVFPAESICCDLNRNGRLLRVSSIRDLTQQIEIEEKLKLTEQKFSNYIKNAPNGFFVANAQGKYLEVNPAASRITGYSEEELLNMSIPDLIPEFELDKAMQHFTSLQKQDFSSAIIRFRRKNGELGHWSVIARKIDGDRFIAFTSDVTEQIEAEQAKKEIDELLVFAVEQMPVPVIIAQAPEVKITHYNQAALDMLVEKRDKIDDVLLDEHRKYWPTYYPDGTPYDVKDLPLTQAIKEGVNTNNREIIVKHPEKDHWISASAAPLRNAEGEIVAGIVVFPEITQIKEIEQELQQQQQLLNEVGEIAHIGGWEMDIITGKAKWTKGTYDIVEIEYDKPIPGLYQHTAYYLPKYRQMIEDKINALIETGQEFEFEAELETAKGNIRWVKAFGRRLMKDGKCIKIYGTFQDITERVHLEEDMRKKNAQMETLLDNTTDFILLSDENAKPVLFNKAYADIMHNILGIEMKPGIKPHLLTKDNEIIQFWENLHKRVLNGESFTAEYSMHDDENKDLHLEISYSPVVENGQIAGFCEISRDVTDRKINELELEKHRQHLEELVKERTAKLEQQNEDLVRMHKVFVNREFRIKELRDDLKALKAKYNITE